MVNKKNTLPAGYKRRKGVNLNNGDDEKIDLQAIARELFPDHKPPAKYLPRENKTYNMTKKLVRITEGDLRSIVKESVSKIIREANESEDFYWDKLYELISNLGAKHGYEQFFDEYHEDEAFDVIGRATWYGSAPDEGGYNEYECSVTFFTIIRLMKERLMYELRDDRFAKISYKELYELMVGLDESKLSELFTKTVDDLASDEAAEIAAEEMDGY